MNATPSRKPKQEESWPRKIATFGRKSITIYRRKSPLGNDCFMVSNYSGEKRRFDSYGTEAEALEAAEKLTRKMSTRDVIGASMTREQSIEYASAIQSLQPLGLTLSAAIAAIVEAVKLTGDLSGVAAAARFYKAKHKSVTPKRVADAVAEMLAVKESRGASVRYLGDLRLRLAAFAEKFPCNVGTIQTADVQAWLDGLKLSTQSYSNYRRVAHVFFEFAKARGYCLDNNPAGEVDRPKIHNGEIEIFTPDETRRLLAAATEDFLPALAIGLFAGLRSAEIERLEWKNIDLKQGHIVVGAHEAKTASRRIVPISENLAEWLKPYAGRTGKVWQGGWLYKMQQDVAATTEVKAEPDKGIAAQLPVKWKANGCRHSCATYMFALSNDAGRIAGYLGNSAAVIHRHYRQLATPADAQRFFNIKPATTVEVLPQPAAQITNA